MQLMIPDPLNPEKMIPVSPEEHPLNKDATEILLALENLEPEQEDQLVLEHSHLPILELIERVVGIEGLGLTHPGLPEKWFKLQEMPDERAMRLLGGPYKENGLPVLTMQELELLRMSPPPPPPRRPPEVALETFDQIQEWIVTQPVSLIPKGSPLKKRENLLARLRRDLLHLLMDAQHEMNLRQQRREWLIDWFRSLSAARQGEGKAPLSALTPEQEEILLDWMTDIVIGDTIAELTQKETLDAFDQELLDTLTATQHTIEEQTLYNECLGIFAEEYINDLQAQETLNVFDQELLDTLTAVTQETAREPIPESEIAPDAKIKNTPQTSSDTNSAREKVVHCSENQVKDIVTYYFESLPTASPGYSVKREYLIQMGSDRRRADIAFLRNGKLIAIAECKRTGRVENGNEQLKSYLCATDTFLDIFANDGDPNKWIFSENHRHNNFLEIDRKTFENYIYNHDKAIKDREKKIKLEMERGIDAEIRELVRKNTDTNAIRQDETDRIKQKVIKNIDKTAIVNSVRSQIAQQAENRLLNKRDQENLKLGRSQGFWWTIFSIIGIGILIALLTSAA